MSQIEEKRKDDGYIDRFADKMKQRMDDMRQQGKTGWWTASEPHLNALLKKNLTDGDSVDVANFVMMISSLGFKIDIPMLESYIKMLALTEKKIEEAVSTHEFILSQTGPLAGKGYHQGAIDALLTLKCHLLREGFKS